jgi:hypothetical protein
MPTLVADIHVFTRVKQGVDDTELGLPELGTIERRKSGRPDLRGQARP